MPHSLKCAVASLMAILCLNLPASAQEDEIEALLSGLQTADAEAARQIEGRIFEIWSQSGSPAMDLLLERGREALANGDAKTAVEHLTALVDHAPNFAEAYNSRATAYFEAGLYGPSLEDIRRALQLEPRHFAAINGLALILQQLGRPEDALAAYLELQKVHPQREGLDAAILRLSREVDGAEL